MCKLKRDLHLLLGLVDIRDTGGNDLQLGPKFSIFYFLSRRSGDGDEALAEATEDNSLQRHQISVLIVFLVLVFFLFLENFKSMLWFVINFYQF